ncbi:putative endoglucanase, partial [Clohesyomyces aquaticus]
MLHLHALFILSLCITTAICHMQMEEPSPLRDPHSNRKEPKDYNILKPLNGDGSDFTCKGYQWNTPLTSVVTYYAGETYELKLRGGATHGGGSCQVSLSCDNGVHFKVIKSMIGGCPVQSKYEFTIPGGVESAQCLLAWTWINRVGNREYYMNCAKNKRGRRDDQDYIDDSSSSSSSSRNRAQKALENLRLPDLYVANLKGINKCKTQETKDVVFPDPGYDVVYGDGL